MFDWWKGGPYVLWIEAGSLWLPRTSKTVAAKKTMLILDDEQHQERRANEVHVHVPLVRVPMPIHSTVALWQNAT